MNIKLDEKLMKMMTYMAAGFVLFVIIIFLFTGCSKTKTYKLENIHELEEKLIEMARNYLERNPDSKPVEGSEITLSLESFIENGEIKPLDEIIIDAEGCTGQINVLNNYGYLLYLPKIDCGEFYRAKTLADWILTEADIVTTGNGLYAQGGGYIYRGDTVDNHLAFAGRLWVILRINADGSIQIMEVDRRETTVWDNRFNVNQNFASGINDFVHNNVNSRVKDRLEAFWADEKEFSEKTKGHILAQDLCVGKRAEEAKGKDGALECAQRMPNQMLGLITVHEFMQASLDPDCVHTTSVPCLNYNFLAVLRPSYWTLTADSETTHRVFRVSDNINRSNATSTAATKLTVLLTPEVLYSRGNGSLEEPFKLITSLEPLPERR